MLVREFLVNIIHMIVEFFNQDFIKVHGHDKPSYVKTVFLS